MHRLAVFFASLFAIAAFPLNGGCNFREAKQAGLELLKPVQPKTTGKAVYQQMLSFPGGAKELLPPTEDFEFREIPLIVLDTKQCTVHLKIESRKVVDGKLSLPLAGIVWLVKRVFGQIWNDFNTESTTGKDSEVVLLNKWPFYSHPGICYYTPYSPDLHRAFPELAEEGREHFSRDMEEALTGLVVFGYIERSDRPLLRKLLPIIFASESIDPFEFKRAGKEDRTRIAEQPFVTLGANDELAYTLKVSSAGAKGPMQVWEPSCRDVRQRYPDAKLAPNCNSAAWGKDDHVGNIAAAALEVMMHRATLTKKKFLGKKITARHDFNRMLLASYNGGPGHVIKAYKKWGRKWDKPHAKYSLQGETVDYLLKCDYLMQSKAVKIAGAH